MAGPQFRQWHWSHLDKGSTVVVTLSHGANVRLMTPSNFTSYKNGRTHRYHGGLAKVSPLRITVPSSGSWYLTVDQFGLKGTTLRIGVSIEPAALPPAKSASSGSLASIRHERPPVVSDEGGETWDVFISHASEDKAAVAKPLHDALLERGLRVWLDKNELRIGDSLRRKIDYGLAHSTFGVVVLSHAFFSKGWPLYELDGIVGMNVDGQQAMLPIWHEISRDEIMRLAPALADKIARNTSINTIAEIANEIAEVVGASQGQAQ